MGKLTALPATLSRPSAIAVRARRQKGTANGQVHRRQANLSWSTVLCPLVAHGRNQHEKSPRVRIGRTAGVEDSDGLLQWLRDGRNRHHDAGSHAGQVAAWQAASRLAAQSTTAPLHLSCPWGYSAFLSLLVLPTAITLRMISAL